MAAKKETPYQVTIVHGKATFKGEGATLYEALKSIKRPEKIVTKTTVRVKHGDKKLEQTWMPARAKRLFFPLTQFFIAKQLELLLR